MKNNEKEDIIKYFKEFVNYKGENPLEILIFSHTIKDVPLDLLKTIKEFLINNLEYFDVDMVDYIKKTVMMKQTNHLS